MNTHDSVFLKKFAALIAGFIVLVLLMVLLAQTIYRATRSTETPPELTAATEARIAPVGGVYAGQSGQMARAAAAAAAQASAQTQVAYDGTLDGAVIYDNLCKTCHDSGAGGAPLMVRSAWDARIAQGMDTMVRHSIDGFTGQFGIMPPRGGNPSLSDEQMQAAVQWMVDSLD